MIKTSINLVVRTLLMFGFFAAANLAIGTAAYAATPTEGGGSSTSSSTSKDAGVGACSDAYIDKLKISDAEKNRMKRSCACDKTPNLDNEQIKSCEACKKGDPNCLENNQIVKRVINPIVKVLSGLVALVIAGSIIYGGIQYSAAGDRADALQAAKKRITNSIIALAVFLLIFTILQWLIPGGIF